MSKGSRQRPKSISDKELKAEWDRIFNKKNKQATMKENPPQRA